MKDVTCIITDHEGNEEQFDGMWEGVWKDNRPVVWFEEEIAEDICTFLYGDSWFLSIDEKTIIGHRNSGLKKDPMYKGETWSKITVDGDAYFMPDPLVDSDPVEWDESQYTEKTVVIESNGKVMVATGLWNGTYWSSRPVVWFDPTNTIRICTFVYGHTWERRGGQILGKRPWVVDEDYEGDAWSRLMLSGVEYWNIGAGEFTSDAVTLKDTQSSDVPESMRLFFLADDSLRTPLMLYPGDKDFSAIERKLAEKTGRMIASVLVPTATTFYNPVTRQWESLV